MEKLDYAIPPRPAGAGPKATAAVAAAVSAWLALGLTCFLGTGWLVLLFPMLSVLAALLGYLARQDSAPGPSSNRTRATVGLWLGVAQLGLFGVLMLLPSPGQAREPAIRVKCASNLRQIGQGIQMYANEHRGMFPPSLDVVLSTQDLTSEVFVCPSSNHERAAGPTTQAVVTNFRANPNLHCSYVYTGAGLTSATATPKHVLAYEHATNHDSDGMNVLYGDGAVQWLNAKQSAHLLSELTAGHNPPR